MVQGNVHTNRIFTDNMLLRNNECCSKYRSRNNVPLARLQTLGNLFHFVRAPRIHMYTYVRICITHDVGYVMRNVVRRWELPIMELQIQLG